MLYKGDHFAESEDTAIAPITWALQKQQRVHCATLCARILATLREKLKDQKLIELRLVIQLSKMALIDQLTLLLR